MLISSFALLATLLPALASTHQPPPALRHRRLAESANHAARGLTAQPAERANLAHSEAHRAIKKAIRKRDGQTCRARPAASSAAPAASSAAASVAAPAAPSASATIENQQAWAQASAAPSASASSGGSGISVNVNVGGGNNNGGGGGGGSSNGLLSVTNGACGWCGSSSDQPNGSEDWLNCGLNGGGWNPPFVSCQELVAADLDASGVFAPCAQYIDKFNQYGNQFGVHPIMLASFAMQESTCNAGATGANGEAGLMQITPANCQANNAGNCWDPDTNIRIGAQLFSQMVASNGGSCLAAIGNYNGWYAGMTTGSVWGAAVCTQMQNMDYLFQFTNGWMQNKNAYSMGQYFNLASC